MDFPGLDECQGFKEFIQGAKSTWKDDEGRGVADEHGFPGEEVPEGHRHIHISIEWLFAREFDAEAD